MSYKKAAKKKPIQGQWSWQMGNKIMLVFWKQDLKSRAEKN